MSILLHACCAPCLTYSYKVFRQDFDDVKILWYNPNIHPFKEYEKRLKSMLKYEEQRSEEIDITYIDEYDIGEFISSAVKVDCRCELCYEKRFNKTAEIAEKNNIEKFSTTLSISPYQDHQLMKEVGKKVEKDTGIKFIYKDLRDGFEEHHELANDMNLYKQGYCGCIFSEKERYKKKIIDD